ncbi:MAG: uroporphyrinogen decarboxylase [Alphaproteobacteria bacterium]|nr:uroporphyrinogen decarboxylase [Alphaproteobacteria bacterium]
MSGAKQKPLLRVLAGERLERSPWWLMRQAGRYLPEYRALRARARDFIDFCLSPALAAEATLQPVRRFGMDAAILFADILLLPQALGQKLTFGEEGPQLDPITDRSGINRFRADHIGARLEPVCETIQRCRGALPAETALIGFAGSPWTVATYMVEGGASRDFLRAKSWAYRDPVGFQALIDLLTEATIAYLAMQISAGAEVVQLFDSWAGALAEDGFERWVVLPTRRITTTLKERFPGVLIIGFPRGAGLLYERYAAESGVTAISLDTGVPKDFARDRLQPRLPLQGNLDPVLLVTGGKPLESAVRELRAALGGGPYVFNLGHGVLPQTPPENVAALARLLAEPL